MSRSNFLYQTKPGGGLSDTYTADQIVGNRLKLKKKVTAYLGHPGSSQTENWHAGFVTPPVYAWVNKKDGLYWMIGELQPIRYIKHDSTALEVRPDSGGAKYLSNPGKSFLENLNFGFGSMNITKEQLLTAGLLVAGVVTVVPVTTHLIKKSIDS